MHYQNWSQKTLRTSNLEQITWGGIWWVECHASRCNYRQKLREDCQTICPMYIKWHRCTMTTITAIAVSCKMVCFGVVDLGSKLVCQKSWFHDVEKIIKEMPVTFTWVNVPVTALINTASLLQHLWTFDFISQMKQLVNLAPQPWHHHCLELFTQFAAECSAR